MKKNSSDTEGLHCAFQLNEKGGGKLLRWDGVQAGFKKKSLLWVHLDRTSPKAQEWLLNESGLDEVVCEALLAEETRPRFSRFRSVSLLNLREMNHYPELTSEELISIRMSIQKNRIISLTRYPLKSVEDLSVDLQKGEGPNNIGELVVFLAKHMTDTMYQPIYEIGEVIDEMEDTWEERNLSNPLEALSMTRLSIIAYHRYLLPQTMVLREMHTLNLSWLESEEKLSLREVSDSSQVLLDILAESRERIWVLRDEHQNRLAARMNRTIYILTVLSALLLPLSVIAGLLGINVDGIPGADHPMAFSFVAGGLVVFLLLEILLLRLNKWL